MKCFIRSNNIKLSKSNRLKIMQQVTKTFDRLKDKINYVVVSLHDVNGHKGGIDKKCQIKIIGHTAIDVQVSDTQNSLHGAVFTASGKAQKTFINRFKKIAGKIKNRAAIRQYKSMLLLAD